MIWITDKVACAVKSQRRVCSLKSMAQQGQRRYVGDKRKELVVRGRINQRSAEFV